MPQFLFLQALARFSNDLKIQVVQRVAPPNSAIASNCFSISARHSSSRWSTRRDVY